MYTAIYAKQLFEQLQVNHKLFNELTQKVFW
jgi:hypothetical protein